MADGSATAVHLDLLTRGKEFDVLPRHRDALLRQLGRQFNLRKYEVDNGLCECFRTNEKKDYFFVGQRLFRFNLNSQNELVLFYKNLEDKSWRTLKVPEYK